MSTKVKPITAWAISCHGMILPFTIRHRRKDAIAHYITETCSQKPWGQLRRHGKRIHKVTIKPITP